MRRAVDWREVETELDQLPDEFKDQGRFDSLPHVVEILRTLDPSQALGELKQRQERVENLVDDIVKGYHGGFNKSIHNYSEILRLFTEAQTQSRSIRASLTSLKKQLGTRTTQLRTHWQKSNALRHTLFILDDIEKIAHVPNKIDGLCGIGDGTKSTARVGETGQGATTTSGSAGPNTLEAYEKCVELISFALDKMGENEDLQQVRALGEMKESILEKKQIVKSKILSEIQRCLFLRRGHPARAKSGDAMAAQNTRLRSLSIHALPHQPEDQTKEHLDRLVTCMLKIDSGEDAFSARVLKEFQPRLQKWIRDFWANVDPFQKNEAAGNQSSSQDGHPPHKSMLCDSKLVKYVHKHVGAMCRKLELIFDKHLELTRAVRAKGKGGNGAPRSEDENGTAFVREVWSQMQAECISLLCVLIKTELPEGAAANGKILPGALTSRRSRSITPSSTGGQSLTFTFSTAESLGKASASASAPNGGVGGAGERISAEGATAQANLVYAPAVTTRIDPDLLGIYLMVGFYKPIRDLIKHIDSKIGGSIAGASGKEVLREGSGERSTRISTFLQDNLLEEFVPRVKNDCTSNLRSILSSLDTAGSGPASPAHKRSYSRDPINSSFTSVGPAPPSLSGAETRALISIVKQLTSFGKTFLDSASHFSAILEAMLLNFVTSLDAQSREDSEGALSRKLASNVSICSLMSQEPGVSDALSADYFCAAESSGGSVAGASPSTATAAESSLLRELQKLRPISSENLYSTASSLGAIWHKAANTQLLVDSVQDFMDGTGSDAKYPLDGLTDLVRRLKTKIGVHLRTLRLEVKVKLLAVTQHLETFSVVEDLGCETSSAGNIECREDLPENSPSYVLIMAGALRQCAGVMASGNDTFFDYLFGDLCGWLRCMKIPEEDLKLIALCLKGTKLELQIP